MARYGFKVLVNFFYLKYLFYGKLGKHAFDPIVGLYIRICRKICVYKFIYEGAAV